MTTATARLLPRARRFLRRRTRVLLLLAGWSLLESAHTFLGGYGLAKALDQGFLAGHTGVGLAWLGVTALAVIVGGLAGRGVFRGLADLVEPLRDSLIRQVVSRSLTQAVAHPARAADSAVVSRLTNQTEIARDSFAGLVLVARSFVFTAAGAVLGLLSLAPQLLLIVVPPLAAGLLLFLATLRPMAARQRAFLQADEDLSTQFGAVAEGLRDVVACGAQQQTAARAYGLIEDEARAARQLARWAAVRCLALGLAGQLPILLLLITAPWLLRQGLTPGVVLGALAYLTQSLLPALHTLMNALGSAGTRLLVVLDRLTTGPGPGPGPDPETTTAPDPEGTTAPDPEGTTAPDPESTTPPDPAPPAPVPPHVPVPPGGPGVRLRAVTFAYGPAAQPVLHDLDLTVEPGEHLVVVGPSGIGKSTLTALVAGLLEPGHGEIRVAGRPVRARSGPDPSLLRVLIPQQAYVFSGTLRENLRYLCPDGASASALEASSDAVGLAPLVRRLGGFDAPLDLGVLSQGERQLIALGRAHLSPAPLVLLDEATCHLDPAAEMRAERAFAERPGTLIVVAHRITSARRADRILVLDGVRATCGTHDELLGRSALYRDLAGSWQPEAPPAAETPERAERISAKSRYLG
ncbi:ABC transporter ATP-binding protein/permease [Streptomyces sp. Je 1-4]|uniref:ATP-binding cassette domain-containing protein n=1 Tax=Streptomyces TaxID=1883 RepID=UPI0021DADB27|nr:MULTISPECIES: ABC transporter ATP-binding protein [unclassified Streptomyces]UYB44228.1 ABC transporter ATP-binding protein/permease [Streptomyces sp. Je 1-4]UZQ40675.1 ABC transporter ATP-binding protein/permease [Streptomyces sp. Je 1-4] [Streptomyces sp. Je 1-4 4N24]UZQ48092.1 ABC transporter ATP-binding protein/permease [Streptomyces sp. Je 1-4] [Streptomyces sp. Je 1-4 4N24_ara]